MDKLKSFLGYTIAVAAFFLLLFSFMHKDVFERLIVATEIHPTEWFSGGAIVKVQKCNGYFLQIRNPVFKKLYGEVKNGFVQISFKGNPDLPVVIHQQISIDGYDFIIETNTKTLTSRILSSNKYVKDTLWTYRFSDNSVNVRIALKNRSI